jgi:transglutaminase-like putative cysteine protease
MSDKQPKYLSPSQYFDFENPSIVAYGHKLVGDETDPLKIVERLYLGVRDDIRYNAYTFDVAPQSFSASHCLKAGESYCIPKAVLLASLCRLYGIPARIGLADVKNHMASPQFLDYLKSDIFVMHGYTDIYLNDKWVKATPAFDQGLCRLMKLSPLEFNGLEDSIFHEFDQAGNKHMEYLREHGTFADLPRDLIIQGVMDAYPHLSDTVSKEFSGHSFYKDLQEQI